MLTPFERRFVEMNLKGDTLSDYERTLSKRLIELDNEIQRKQDMRKMWVMLGKEVLERDKK